MERPSPLLAGALAHLYRHPNAPMDDFWRITADLIEDFYKGGRQDGVVDEMVRDGYATIALSTHGRDVVAAGQAASDDSISRSTFRALQYMASRPRANLRGIWDAAEFLGNYEIGRARFLAQSLSDGLITITLTRKGERIARRAAAARL